MTQLNLFPGQRSLQIPAVMYFPVLSDTFIKSPKNILNIIWHIQNIIVLNEEILHKQVIYIWNNTRKS